MCLSVSLQVSAQIQAWGTVVGKISGKPLSYATVGVVNSPEGKLTNEDGVFVIELSVDETIEIRYIGYITKRIHGSDFQEGDIEIEMEKSVQNLAAFNVSASDERAYEYIRQIQKILRRSGYYQSKAFMELFTYRDSVPAEVLQIYYIADMRKSRTENLTYKSGRWGVAPVDNSYFLSLGTSEVFQMQNLLEADYFPESVLTLKKSEIREFYNLSYAELSTGKTLVFFTPDSAFQSRYFEGELVINANQIPEEITLHIDRPEVSPFIPLFETDSLSPISLDLNWKFKDVNGEVLPYLIDFDYSYYSVIPIGLLQYANRRRWSTAPLRL